MFTSGHRNVELHPLQQSLQRGRAVQRRQRRRRPQSRGRRFHRELRQVGQCGLTRLSGLVSDCPHPSRAGLEERQ